MKRIAIRLSLGLGALVVLLVGTVGAIGHSRWDRTFDVPEVEVHVSTDPAVIERGRYLAFGPAHCAACHTPNADAPRVEAGEEIALVGGYDWELPFGQLRSANLTPDAETGIGRFTDGQLARMIRHNVRADGQAVVPIMEFQNMSEEDVTALISYLRSMPPVRNPVPQTEYNALGKVIKAFLVRPTAPNGPVRATSPAAVASVERGEYLVNDVAACAGCHSPRSTLDGSYTGPRLSGGGPMPVDGVASLVVVPPNLTPDPKTGRIAAWTEAQFLARFRAGKVVQGSHMPWGPYGRMSDDDLRAVYRYLKSLEPVENETGPSLQPAKS